MSYFYTYLIYNGSQFYIGDRKCECLPKDDTDYLGSLLLTDAASIAWDKTIKSKTVLRTFDNKDDCRQHEIDLHEFFDVGVNPKFVNKCKQTSTGFSFSGRRHTKESKAKMSKVHKGRVFTEEHKANLRGKGKPKGPMSDEAKLKISISLKGKKRSLEAIEKTASAHRGMKRSPECCQKISEKALARGPLSEEHKKAIGDGGRGAERSDETKANISNALKGKEKSQTHCDNLSKALKASDKNKGLKAGRANHTIYVLQNDSTGEILADKKLNLVPVIRTSNSAISKLFNGKQKSTKSGWRPLICLIDNVK